MNVENTYVNKVNLGSPAEWFLLVVGDDGSGFPERIDFRETDSLGLQLVTNLVDQIDGSIKLDNSRGTEFKIRFRELKYKTKGYRLSQNSPGLYIWVINIGIFIFFKGIDPVSYTHLTLPTNRE